MEKQRTGCARAMADTSRRTFVAGMSAVAAVDTLAIQRHRPQLARYTEWSPNVADGLEDAVSGKVPTKQALDEAARKANQYL